jgi:hypothetical protein
MCEKRILRVATLCQKQELKKYKTEQSILPLCKLCWQDALASHKRKKNRIK